MLRICEFPRWERNNSLAAGGCLFGVAVGYDWLLDQLDDRERALVRDKLVCQAEALIQALPVHHDIWLANHNHVEHLGLAAAGFALRGEVPQAEAWIRQADAVFRKAMEFSGPATAARRKGIKTGPTQPSPSSGTRSWRAIS
jgi:hypothetical protein